MGVILTGSALVEAALMLWGFACPGSLSLGAGQGLSLLPGGARNAKWLQSVG